LVATNVLFPLTQIAADYRETLDEGARKNSSMLEVLSTLISSEITALGYIACERGLTVRFTRVIDMINRLMHHGEAIVIQGTSFRMKDSTPDE
jgi:hypothetical protein